jgi:hypothetical protein
MRGRPRRRDLVSAILGLSVAACTSIGPGTVSHDRIDYATAIGNSWKEQTLIIVKLRYADMPIFLANRRYRREGPGAGRHDTRQPINAGLAACTSIFSHRTLRRMG